MEAAYFGVYVWKQAVEKAKSFDVGPVRKAVYGQTFLAPGGQIKMDEANPPHLQAGTDRRDPQGRTVQGCLALEGPGQGRAVEQVHEPGQGCDWVQHQGTYQKKA